MGGRNTPAPQLLWYPVRFDLQSSGLLRGIVRLEWNLEQVLAIHPFVHHEIRIQSSGLTRF